MVISLPTFGNSTDGYRDETGYDLGRPLLDGLLSTSDASLVHALAERTLCTRLIKLYSQDPWYTSIWRYCKVTVTPYYLRVKPHEVCRIRECTRICIAKLQWFICSINLHIHRPVFLMKEYFLTRTSELMCRKTCHALLHTSVSPDRARFRFLWKLWASFFLLFHIASLNTTHGGWSSHVWDSKLCTGQRQCRW